MNVENLVDNFRNVATDDLGALAGAALGTLYGAGLGLSFPTQVRKYLTDEQSYVGANGIADNVLQGDGRWEAFNKRGRSEFSIRFKNAFQLSLHPFISLGKYAVPIAVGIDALDGNLSQAGLMSTIMIGADLVYEVGRGLVLGIKKAYSSRKQQEIVENQGL